MIDVKKQILEKFPSISDRNPMIKESLFKIAQKLIHEDKINDFLKQNSHLEGFDFVEATLDYFKFDFSYSNNDIGNIPSSGRVVVIANHPLGALDGLCLLKLISQVRRDVRIVANDFLAGVNNLNSLFINIDNYKHTQSKKSIQEVYNALNNEEAVIIFPAGEVSRVSTAGIKDKKWKKGFLKFARKTHSPILPILVDAKNSKTFYTISIINKTFSTLLLSDEMFKKHDKNISIKIGKIIPYEYIIPDNIEMKDLPNLYKEHLYSLKKGVGKKFKTVNAIAPSSSRQDIKKELKNTEVLGKTNDDKIIYLYSYTPHSVILNEIGRLREISFRKVNEGVNQKRDTDKYDKHYKHIILWDDEDLEIVGAYRIAIADDIHKDYDFDGFYANTLFKFKKSFLPYMENSIELGRSFVQPKYWGSRALDYLWYGIGAFLKQNPQIKYMYGPVSLSTSYPQYAKELIVDFYSFYFKGDKKIVEALSPFEYETQKIALDNPFSFTDYKKDLKLLKSKLKNMNVSIPTLYKQYSELSQDDGVKFYGFNIDSSFSDCVDGFIMVEIEKIKQSKKDRYIK